MDCGQWPKRNAMRAGPGGDDRGFRQQHECPAREVDVFVGDVVSRRHAANRPVRGRVDVAHRELDPREWAKLAGEPRCGQQAFDHPQLARFPCEAGAHVDRLHGCVLGFVGGQHRAIEPARK